MYCLIFQVKLSLKSVRDHNKQQQQQAALERRKATIVKPSLSRPATAASGKLVTSLQNGGAKRIASAKKSTEKEEK